MFLAVDTAQMEAGPWMFVFLALIAVATILLILDMVRRMRRTRMRAEINELLDAEAAAAATKEAKGKK